MHSVYGGFLGNKFVLSFLMLTVFSRNLMLNCTRISFFFSYYVGVCVFIALFCEQFPLIFFQISLIKCHGMLSGLIFW